MTELADLLAAPAPTFDAFEDGFICACAEDEPNPAILLAARSAEWRRGYTFGARVRHLVEGGRP